MARKRRRKDWGNVHVRLVAKSATKREGKSIAALIDTYRGARAQFARDLSKLSGQQIRWERVNGWIERNSVPKSMVLYVHRLTGAPLADLLR